MTRSATALALAALLHASPAPAQELGRLFLTPEQRTALDARRNARVPDRPAAAPTVVAPVTRIDGYVQRPGGKSTVWVNGQAVPEGTRDPNASIQPGGAGTPSVAIQIGETNRDARARVGQSIDTVTGAVRDPLGEGEITVKRPGAPREGRAR